MAKVVVIGAGMAGLTAALRLTQAGHDVTVLEAQNRVGGRLRSMILSNGEVAELGGEWLRSDQQSVVALAQEVGVQMSPVGVDFAARDLMGSPPVPSHEHRRVADVVAVAYESLSPVDRSRLTAQELLTDLDDGSDAFTVLQQRLEASAGMPMRSIAVDEIVGDFGVGEASYLRVAGGNESLAEAVAGWLSDVRMNQQVERIQTTDAGAMVSTAIETIAADAVVVAVPLPIISRLRFDPPLGRALTAALGRLVMATAAKLVVPTESQPPLLARQSGEATWWCWTGAGEDGSVRSAVTAFAGTQRAIDAVSDDWRIQVADALPEVRLRADSTFIDWGQEEWFGGCYSALGPGDEALLGVFQDEGSVVFAGEHTLASGSIDGAIESGERAASRVEESLGGRTL
ncbi:MAG: FAD-dependent oxidoreductase [bacterium]|nr:FAD-dependent oxidoreductase [bacterium]